MRIMAFFWNIFLKYLKREMADRKYIGLTLGAGNRL